MTFLNFVEKTDHNDLVKILLQLYDDLSNSKLDSLRQYHVKWNHVPMEKQQPNTDFDHYLWKRMHLNGAEGAKIQCAQECWGDQWEACATELYKLIPNKREKILPLKTLCVNVFG